MSGGLGWDAADGRLGPAAGYYAGLGWKVFACHGIVHGKCTCGEVHASPKDVGKHPLGGSGHLDASSDAREVMGRWVGGGEWNVGVYCAGSGFIVVDVDPRNGGLESWDRLEELTEGTMEDTVEAWTGQYGARGGVARGRHLFYRVKDGEVLKGKVEGVPGIDIKHKGYVLVAPSRHGSGLIYEWAPGKAPWERQMAWAPEELLGLLRKGAPKGSGESVSEFGVMEWAGEKIDVDALVRDGIPDGERAVTLFRIACSIANEMPHKVLETERGKQVVRFQVKSINDKACRPPMEWGTGGGDDFSHQCDNAIKYVLENPKDRLLAEKISPELMSWAKGKREEGEALSLEERGKEISRLPRRGAGAAEMTTAEAVTGGSWSNIGGDFPADPDAAHEEDGGDPNNRSCTDIGNGRRIVDYAGEGVRYSNGIGWLVWNGQYWVPDTDTSMVREIAKRLPIWIGSEIYRIDEADLGAADKADTLMKWAQYAKSSSARKNAIEDASVDVRIRVPVTQWDSDAEMLGVRNGTINLRTGDLLAASPEHYITKQSRVAYQPGMKNYRWEQFLDFATGGDKELQRYLQMAAGYTLTGNRDHEVMFLVYGPAGSGKSTFMEVLGTLLGDYYITLDSDVLVETQGVQSSLEYHMAQLMGKRMIGISEWPQGKKTKEDQVKRLTGDTMVTGRHPSGRPFQFESQAKLWIGTNVKPQIQERAMWRRIRAIHFNHVPENPDPGLKPYLLDPEGALPAALSWAVEGAVMLLGSAERSPLRKEASRAVLEATDEYMKQEDRFGMFLSEETRDMAGGGVLVTELRVHYRRWLEDRGEREPGLTTVINMLQEKGEKVSGTGNKTRLEGRVLNPRVVPSVESGEWSGLVDASRSR